MSSPLGHATALSEDAAARGGYVVRCLAGPCSFRVEGTAAEVVAAAADHHDETAASPAAVTS